MGTILQEYQWIIILAIIIVAGLIGLFALPRNRKAHLNNTADFFKDMISIFYGNNYTVTLWFTFLMALSIVLGLLGLLVGASHEYIPEHSHWLVLEIIFLWGIAIVSLRLITKQTIVRSLLFAGISIFALLLCFRLFEWPFRGVESKDSYGFIIGIAGFMASAIGIFISIRVFMQIKNQNKVNSIDRYLNETISIVKNALPGDEIYIIAPSFCIGMIENPYLLDVMHREIERRAKNGTIFHFAFPSIETKNSTSTSRHGKNETVLNNNPRKQRPTKDYHWSFLCSIIHDEFRNETDKLLSKIYDGYNSYYSRIEAVLEKNDKSSLTWLDIGYLHKNAFHNNEINVFSGFYATANVGPEKIDPEQKNSRDRESERGCFLGTFYVSEGELFFTGGDFIYPGNSENLKLFLENEFKSYKKR